MWLDQGSRKGKKKGKLKGAVPNDEASSVKGGDDPPTPSTKKKERIRDAVRPRPKSERQGRAPTCASHGDQAVGAQAGK